MFNLMKNPEVEDTILHEIAHVHLRGSMAVIQRTWQDMERLGDKGWGNSKACSKANLIKPETHYKYDQECCGVRYQKHRIRKRARYYCYYGRLFVN